jgi:hypothetical protein
VASRCQRVARNSPSREQCYLYLLFASFGLISDLSYKTTWKPRPPRAAAAFWGTAAVARLLVLGQSRQPKELRATPSDTDGYYVLLDKWAAQFSVELWLDEATGSDRFWFGFCASSKKTMVALIDQLPPELAPFAVHA